MPRRARIHFVSLHSSLVNLPISIYGPLLERSVRPQHLAVHLTLVSGGPGGAGGKLEAYVGWTGMASASSLAHFNASQSAGGDGFETIEIDPQYAQGLGFSQGDLVEIGLIHDMPPATMVGTEPLTSDDWEIVEIHASHVESTLLSQVRVAKVRQEIDVWVMGRTRVRLRVVSIDPPAKNDALLLTTNTEVSIAPKLHKNQQRAPSKSAPDTTTKPADEAGSSNAMSKSPTKPGKIELLRVLPSRFVKIPSTDSVSELVAFVSPATFNALFEPESRRDDESNVCFQVQFKRLPGPVDPTSNTDSTPPNQVSTARVLKAGSADKEKNNDQVNAQGVPGTGEVYIGCSPNIIDQHIVFAALTNGIEEWDTVRVTAQSGSPSVSIERTNKSEVDQPIKSSSNFLAGVDDILKKCKDHCIRQFIIHSQQTFVHGVSALLVTGRSGAGKTSIVRAVAKNLQEDSRTHTYIHYVDVSKYTDTPISTMKNLFSYWFEKAAWNKPSVIILDNLDRLLSAEVEHADSFRSRQLTEVFLSTYSSAARTAAANCYGIIMIATAASTSSIHSLLNNMHLFKEVVHVQPPNKDARRDILSRITQSTLETAKDITIDSENPLNFTALATQTEGYSALDLQDLVARAIHQVVMRAVQNDSPASLTAVDFSTAQADFVPLSLRDVKLQKSDIAWSDIGGLYETRQVLRETLEWPTKYAPIFAQSPLRLRSGLLLYGYPGCGKTLLASAVAKECGLNFISVKGPEILNKYIGASEQSVRDLFERASAAKPCILFFDEFDSIAPKRGHDSTGVTDRVVNQLLTQMDGAEGLEGVYVLAATSRPDLIDSALLRPGRLDKSLLCNMPDKQERKDILEAVTRKLTLSPSVDLSALGDRTDGFSGADLQALIYNAHLEVVHESIAALPALDKPSTRDEETPVEFAIIGDKDNSGMSRAQQMALQRRLRQIIDNHRQPSQPSTPPPSSAAKGKQPETKRKHEIRQDHIDKVLKTTRPSVPPGERLRLERIYKAFISDRSDELPVPPNAGGIGNRVSLG
ncbi:AAA-domain-containing protein [Macrolepiota fuliginosa MF-IS2]|uniref:Peroxisomal ATPase PEX1 n=1 Tax=Macrolepiota fuliginosa MF-IS2 TaxID=1400762 RepID=A0A9P5XM02_9AGAR|nr:AAA-domain-containing protein [Macrolepiota fuliginosa MF-IS2]